MMKKGYKFVKPAPVIERVFNAPVSKVWKVLTNKEDIKQWSFDIKEFKPEVGFEFQIDKQKEGVRYLHLCKITKVTNEKALAYTWRYEGYEGNSLVIFELFDEGDKTKLRLTHKGLETFPKIPAFSRKNFKAGWTQIIGKNLKQFIEE